MQKYLKVKITYHGRYTSLTGVESEMLELPLLLSQSYENLRGYLRDKYAINPPYIMMINNMNIIGALKKDKYILKEEDVIKIIPFISGG